MCVMKFLLMMCACPVSFRNILFLSNRKYGFPPLIPPWGQGSSSKMQICSWLSSDTLHCDCPFPSRSLLGLAYEAFHVDHWKKGSSPATVYPFSWVPCAGHNLLAILGGPDWVSLPLNSILLNKVAKILVHASPPMKSPTINYWLHGHRLGVDIMPLQTVTVTKMSTVEWHWTAEPL